jgi:Domain of unknown function (DUF4148)
MQARLCIAIYVTFFATAGIATGVSAHENTRAEVRQEAALSTATVASDVALAPAQPWVPSNGQPTMQKTRAQVYQELVQSERDGEMQRLDSTIFAGG